MYGTHCSPHSLSPHSLNPRHTYWFYKDITFLSNDKCRLTMRRSKFSHFCLILHNATPTHIHQLLTHTPHTLLLLPRVTPFFVINPINTHTNTSTPIYWCTDPQTTSTTSGYSPHHKKSHRTDTHQTPSLPFSQIPPLRPRVGSYLTPRPHLLTKKSALESYDSGAELFGYSNESPCKDLIT